MRILYYHQHFSTPKGATGNRSYEMARRLIQRGHQVTMVCGSYGMADTGLTGEFLRGRREGMIDGIRVIEFYLPYSNRDGFLKRTWTFLKFAAKSTAVALTEQYDLIFATSTPLTAGIPGIFASLLRRKPFVFEVRDLWPELPREMGVITNPVVLKAMDILEWVSYHTARGCIGLSPGIAEGIIRRGIPREKVAMVPNGCDLELFDGQQGDPARPEGVSETDFVAVFTGAHGIANGLDAVLDAAAELKKRGRADIKLVFIGDGKLKPGLMERADREGLENCLFLDPVPKLKLLSYLRGADAGLMILDNIPAFYYGTSPNKFFDYIAIGLPVLNNYPGWLAGLITENQCGIAVEPESPEAFADALIRMADDRGSLQEMGQNARALAERDFNRALLSRQFAEFLESTGRAQGLLEAADEAERVPMGEESISAREYDAVAELHINNLDQSFLSSLGMRFLALMYRCIDESKNSTLFVYKVDGRVAGFVTGTTGFGEIYKIMLTRHGLSLARALLPCLVSPRKLLRILEILTYSKKHGSGDDNLPAAELLSIAVDRDFRGQQIADALYQDLCTYFQREGVDSFKIVVGVDLQPAHRFYTRMGARPVGDIEVHKGEKSVIYVHELQTSKEDQREIGAEPKAAHS